MKRSIYPRCVQVLGALIVGLWPAWVMIAADPPAGHPVLVELFTSQGCSSCPPADRLLSKLGGENAGRVIPLAFHVDYWNHGGWSDPFSRHSWTDRQTEYGHAFGLTSAYTPQAVVDGGVEVVGSKEDALRTAIATAAAKPAAEISLHLESEDTKVVVTADVALPDSLRGRKLDLMLAIYETGLVTAVGRGENGGHTLHDDYVVRVLRRADRLAAGGPERSRLSATLPLEKDWKKSDLGVAAFLQDPHSLVVCGAARASLNATNATAPSPQSH